MGYPHAMSGSWSEGELATVRLELESTRDDLRRRTRSRVGTGPICGDAVDHASQAVESELDDLALARDLTSLEQTELVLERLAFGRYDRCERCGREIPKARLKASPRASLCLDCAHTSGGPR